MDIKSLIKSFGPVTLILSFLAIAFTGVLGLGLYAIGVYNGANSALMSYNMKIKSNEAEFDGMWKKIQQAAEVPNQKKQAFKEIFEGYAKSRSVGNVQLMTWIKEAVPNVDMQIYDNLMNIITGSRDSWTMKQNELVARAEEYNQKLTPAVSGNLLRFMGFVVIEPKVITSTRTEATFVYGKDDEVTIFK